MFLRRCVLEFLHSIHHAERRSLLTTHPLTHTISLDLDFDRVLCCILQIAVIRQQLEEQHVNQEGRMQEMKTMLLEEVRMKVYGRLKEVVESIVRGVVAREVQRRVRKEVSDFVSLRFWSDIREAV